MEGLLEQVVINHCEGTPGRVFFLLLPLGRKVEIPNDGTDLAWKGALSEGRGLP